MRHAKRVNRVAARLNTGETARPNALGNHLIVAIVVAESAKMPRILNFYPISSVVFGTCRSWRKCVMAGGSVAYLVPRSGMACMAARWSHAPGQMQQAANTVETLCAAQVATWRTLLIVLQLYRYACAFLRLHLCALHTRVR